MKNKVICLIPARSGSKGIPNKNILPIKGHPLIAYSIMASKLSKYIDRTIVSTDSPKIADIALYYGAEVPFLRPTELAKDTSTDLEWVEHALDLLESDVYDIPSYIVHLRPTTPIRDVQIVNEAIAMCICDKECTSLRSVHQLAESPFKMFAKEGDYLKPYIPAGYEGEYYNQPRQKFPTAYVPNGYVDVLKVSTINLGSLHGDKIRAFETRPSIEIDRGEDILSLKHEVAYNLDFNRLFKKIGELCL